ncbi:MAG: hypothetical protein MJ189_01240 [Coriobacteriales bacterium]|nr:hypothetical protein [Coriobacteriales bacterium]
MKRINNFYFYLLAKWSTFLGKLKSQKGQGTTEYAILVGVLAVIAIIAITLFKDKLAELWNSIQEGINGL